MLIIKSILKLSALNFIIMKLNSFLSKTEIFPIQVGSEYLYYIYAAMVTFSAVSVTVLSLILNSTEKKYYGIPIKELFNTKKSLLSVSKFIPIIFFLNILSLFFLAKNMINIICLIFIFILIYIGYVSIVFWGLATNDEYCEKRINKFLNNLNNNNSITNERIIKYLFDEIIQSQDSFKFENLTRNINLINKIYDKQEKQQQYITSLISLAFNQVAKEKGVKVAIDKILLIKRSNKKQFDKYDNWDIIYPHIKKIQFISELEFYSLGYDKLLIGLEEINTITNEVKDFTLYNMYKSILNNEKISTIEKSFILNQLISSLVEFSSDINNTYTDVQQKVILYILKYGILTNRNDDQSEFLVKMLSLKLYRGYHCKYEDEKYFYETIALIYFTIYLYSENEVETISLKHREKIKGLIYLSQDNISNKTISFQTVITKYFDEIIKALFNISEEKFQSLTFLENFENFIEAKSVVWSFTSLINFAMCNFFLTYKYNNPIELIDNWENIKDKDIYAREINDFFDIDKENDKNNVLRPKKHEKINSIAKWISRTPYVNKKFVNSIGEKINNTAKQVNEKKIKNNGVLDDKNVSEKIKKQVNEKFEKSKLDEYSTSIELSEDDKEYYFAEIKDTQYLQEQYHEKIVDRIYEKLLQILYNEISKSIKPKKIDYNINGVESLIEDLNSNRYTKTNFNLIRELFYFKDRLKTENWDFLEQLNLENVENIYLKSKVVYKDYLPKFNIKVKEYKIEKLNDTECEKYSEKFKISNEYYKIDNAYYTKSEVMDLIYEKNRKVVVIYTFKIEENNNFSGFKLNFDYSKLEKEDKK